MRLGKHVQGKGIDLPVRSRRQTTLQVQTRTQKKERKGIDTCTTSIFVGLQVSSAAAAETVSVCSGRQMKGSRWRGNVAVLPL